MPSLRRLTVVVARSVVFLVVVVLLLVGAGLVTLETGWAKNQIRRLIIRQANQYLTATLDIGSLGGSLLRGLQLDDVTLSRDDEPIIHIDQVALSYSIRELVEGGTIIRRLQLTKPRIVGRREAGGGWNLGALVKRDARQQNRSGPQRPIAIQSIEIVDADIQLHDPLDFGAAHVPTTFRGLNASMAFSYQPVKWTLAFNALSWVGRDPTLDVTRMGGSVGQDSNGWFFDHLRVETPRSAFTVDGRVRRGETPTSLALTVHADRFAFQEWSGVIRGLRFLDIEARFDAVLDGPLKAMDTTIHLSGTGGAVDGMLTLDTTVPGWHGRGAVDVATLNLARWLNRPDRPSNITGHVGFDLDLDLGGHFPRGAYSFDGSHTEFMGYAAEHLTAHGHLTAQETVIENAVGVAYGARIVASSGTIALDHPFPFHFTGSAADVDLRAVPPSVPVPHVESVLTFDYDVTGRFAEAFIAGRAAFADSTFLGMTIGSGTIGTIDTSQTPMRYTGDGAIEGADINRLGRGLEVEWMQDPRYAGSLSGRFQAAGTGSDRSTLTLDVAGRIARARLFRGEVADADVSLAIEHGTLRTRFDGRFAGIDPAIAFADRRMAATLTGRANVSTIVHDLLTRTPALGDYEVEGTMSLNRSTIRDLAIDSAQFDGGLRNEALSLKRLTLSGPALEGGASGSVSMRDDGPVEVQYEISRGDLARLQPYLRASATGELSSKGTVSGPRTALRAAGSASVAHLEAYGVRALTLNGDFEAALPTGRDVTGRVTGRGSFLDVFDVPVQQADGTISIDGDRIGFDVGLRQEDGRTGTFSGAIGLRDDRHAFDVNALTIAVGPSPWALVPVQPAPLVAWTDDQITVSRLEFAGGSGGAERISVSGTWRQDGKGTLNINATNVYLETLQGAFSRPARYGGLLQLDASVSGTRAAPLATGTVTVTAGRVERVAYEKLAARFGYSSGVFTIDARLDQAPGIWLTAAGTVPRAAFSRGASEQPIDLAVKSSPISLGLLEGMTDVVRNVSGQALVDVRVVGTAGDPHFNGSLDISNAGFLVASTGSRYKNLAAAFKLETDRVMVDSLHVEDVDGDPLDVHGSLATHELRVGELAIDITGRRFEIIRNEFGRVDMDAALTIGGRFESPRVMGELAVSGDVKVDEILAQTLAKPYSTQPLAAIDAVAALNPWDRLGMDLTLHVPESFRLTGSNIQVSNTAAVGLGDINIRGGGDVYLYKDPGKPLSLNGSLWQLSGTYVFQGRRFDLVEGSSSINFVGDLNPNLYITVSRIISAVDTRVTIAGTVQEPELHLASTPPLDESDILALIVFGTSPNSLNSAQQQELAVRAGALAAGFLAAPLMNAIQKDIGLDILEVSASGDTGAGPKVTLGDEVLPGVVARFSRQFGPEPYDEATIEYFLSRILRLRATFSDAESLNSRSPFRRVERAGIDLLFFFSF